MSSKIKRKCFDCVHVVFKTNNVIGCAVNRKQFPGFDACELWVNKHACHLTAMDEHIDEWPMF